MNQSVLKKLMKEIKPYRISVGLSFVCALISVAASLWIPIDLGKAVDLIVGTGNVDFEALKPVLVRILAVVLVSGICQWCMGAINNRIVYGVTEELRIKAFRKIQSLPLATLDPMQDGDLVSRMISDTDRVSDGLLLGFSQLFSGVLAILGTLVFMFIVNVWLALVVSLLTPLSLFVAKFIAEKSHVHFENQAKSRGLETAYINEIIRNEKTVRAYNQESRVMRAFDKRNEALRAHSLKSVFYSSLVNPSTRFVNAVIYALVGVVGAVIIVKSGGNALTVGLLTSFLTYAGQYAKPFNEISGVITELKNAAVSAERIYEILELSGETEPKTPLLRRPTAGKVEFKNVSFSYVPEKPLITNFNLTVEPGEHVAIVGKTGCGKTTLINLLMRFYETGSGEILIDGESIRDMRRDEVRSRFGMVLQDTFITAGTVADNIRIGKPEASREEVFEAAKKAHADSFIRLLPDGYDTVLSENGDGLSEGQKQLLCIARVMLSLPPMLILDEATSSIDTRTELRIQDGFNALMKGRTAFIVAHRLSTIENADRILVMADGHIAEQGTHEELLEKKGVYYDIYESQYKGISV